MATLDAGLNVLRSQILAQCPLVNKAEIGWIAGPDHRQSGPHFPENPPPPGNPPSEVDAIDVPHAPARGLSCYELTEQLRLSRDDRLQLVIFDGQQFSSYERNGIPSFTWRDYDEEDQHTDHAHIQTNDSRTGNRTRPWQISLGGIMADSKDVQAANWRLDAMAAGSDKARGGPAAGESIWIVTKIKELLARPAVVAGPVDEAALKLVLTDPEVLAAYAKATNDEYDRRIRERWGQ
jgi:hypothetical protein